MSVCSLEAQASLGKMGSASPFAIGISVVFYLIAFGLALGAMARHSKVNDFLASRIDSPESFFATDRLLAVLCCREI